ncbi:hypothetical protein H257_16423 [Aphanomyces astaci]|uniref:Uncharacterized protein n=1 Tax=Aphanomyces astaci TaxID=112090 RepID=W4FIM1_APHAT|nr:hypothetical protein H257_16423 [Aphanomyces astaci]ETV67340.1 hypothetical protein H257_16423 [Aphanomyces astaci]|eukprot:XP_009843155.1 hypothetical protein H257_16423 [Aphanomyces astaci]
MLDAAWLVLAAAAVGVSVASTVLIAKNQPVQGMLLFLWFLGLLSVAVAGLPSTNHYDNDCPGNCNTSHPA